VVPGDIKDVDIEISDALVDVIVEWPIKISKGDLESSVNVLRATLPIRLGRIHDEMSSFMSVQLQNPDEICLSCLLDTSQRNNFTIEIDNMITTYVFVVKDRQSKLEKPYEFIFANGY